MSTTVQPASDPDLDPVLLLARAAAGDLAAYGVFVDLSAPPAHGLARLLVGSTEVDALLVACYVAAWRSLGEYGTSGLSPFAWLLSRLQVTARGTGDEVHPPG